MGSILFLLAFKLILLYLIYKAFLEMGIGFDSTLLLPKSERLFQLFALNSLIFFDSIGVKDYLECVFDLDDPDAKAGPGTQFSTDYSERLK
jgi:hypothetical protein